MESLKHFSAVENPKTKPFFDVEGLSQYDDYIKGVIEQSRRADIAAREWASKNYVGSHIR